MKREVSPMFLKIINGSIEIEGKTILEEVNFEIKKKDKIAIIGRNGSGKTTLLKGLIDTSNFIDGVGEERFQIIKNGNPIIGYLNQNQKLNNDNTLLDEILSVYSNIIDTEKKLQELEQKMESSESGDVYYQYEALKDKYNEIGGYKYKKEYLLALKKFGLKESDFDKKIENFSGGERTKIAFLKMLLSKPDILILDEPTNHLDIGAIEWLENYLVEYQNSIVIVSHDRMFIDRVANVIYEIEYGKTEIYKGDYKYYEKEKRHRYEKMLKEYEYQQKEIKRLQAIADKFRYKPSKASMAMAKLRVIDRMIKIEKPNKADMKTFGFKESELKESGKVVLSINNLTIGYDKPLGTISFELLKKRRLGIIGENGTGKSTLLKTIIGEIAPLKGSFDLGFNVSIGYFDQSLNMLDNSLTVYDEFKDKFPTYNNFEIRKALASFMFSEEDILKKVEVLSGGEKVLLQLCEVLYKKPNFLILDEPTNHLDIISKERLENILNEYEGTILFVSHDRYFVKNIADSLFVFENGDVSYYDLTYEEYLERRKNVSKDSGIDNKVVLVSNKKEDLHDKNKNIRRLENMIDKRENRLKELKNSLFKEEVYNDIDKVKETENKINELEKEISLLIQEWENISK